MFFLFFAVCESVLEASLIIFCYGNERFTEKFFKRLVIAMYLFMAVIVGTGAYLLLTREPSFELIQDYFALPVMQLVPIIGLSLIHI